MTITLANGYNGPYVSVFARTILDDADAAAVRTTIGAVSLPVVDETALVYKTGTPANTLTFDVAALSAARIVTWPDAAFTVAGLQVANIFTVAQTFNLGAVFNETGGNSDFRIEGDNQTDLFLVDASYDQICIGVNAGDGLGNLREYYSTPGGFAASSNRAVQIDMDVKYGADNSKYYMAQSTALTIRDNYNYTGTIGVVGYNVVMGHNGTGTVAKIIGQNVLVRTGAAGIATESIGYRVQSPTKFAGSTMTSVYGVYIETIDVGANNYAIYTNLGANRFGDKTTITQPSLTGAAPTLQLTQSDLSEEFIRFVATIGAGNPIDTAALGAYYGKVRVYVDGVGAKWLALYD